MKRVLSTVLLVCMLASMFTLSAWAEPGDPVALDWAQLKGYLDDGATRILINNEIEVGSPITITGPVDIIYGEGASFLGDPDFVIPDGYFGYEGGTGLLFGENFQLDTDKFEFSKDKWGYHIVPIPDYPKVISRDVSSEKGLTAAMQFAVDPGALTWPQLAYYGQWYQDFSITVNKPATSEADGTLVLSMEYDLGENTENTETLSLAPNTTHVDFLNSSFANNLDEVDYGPFGPAGAFFVFNAIIPYSLGVSFTEEYLAANPGATVTISLDMHEGYSNGQYTGTSKSLASKTFVVSPIPSSSVPATADNSNVPLWGGLFILFAAAAVLTGKKRRS